MVKNNQEILKEVNTFSVIMKMGAFNMLINSGLEGQLLYDAKRPQAAKESRILQQWG